MDKKQKIAVIEDDLPIQQMYQFKLESEGYSVKCASSGKDGLELCKSFSPDLVLLDLRMPDISGDEVLRRIREADWGASIRVVVLTNISKSEAPSNLRILNVERYIVKAHHTPQQVMGVVREILGSPNKKSAIL